MASKTTLRGAGNHRPTWRAQLGAILLWLVEPGKSLTEADRRRARLLSGLLLAMILLAVLAFPISFLIDPNQNPLTNPALPVAIGATLFLGLAYGLNRAGHYRPAAGFTISIAALGAWASIIANRYAVTADPLLVVYVMISVLLSSILLSARETAMVAAAQLVGVVLVAPEFISGLIFMAFLTGLILVSAIIRQYDVAQINRQTREIADREAHFRALLENSSDGISLLDPNGQSVYESPAASRILGFTTAELVGRRFADLLYPGDREPTSRLLTDLLRAPSSSVTTQFRYRHKDGSWVWLEAIATNLLGHPSVKAVVVNYRDITERKLAEQALREADQRAIRDYEQLLERLTRLAQVVGTAQRLGDVYRGLLEFAQASVPCDAFSVSLYVPERRERTWAYAWRDGQEADPASLPPMPFDDSPQSRAVATGQIVVTADLQAAPARQSGNHGAGRANGAPAQSSLAVPMTVMGQVIGVLEVQSLAKAAYSRGHVTAMWMAANLGAIGTENMQLLERERQLRLTAQASEEHAYHQAARAESLARVAARLNEHFDLDTLLQTMCEETAHALAVPIVSISLYDPSQDALALAAAVGLPSDALAQVTPLPRAMYDAYALRQGPVPVTLDVQAQAGLPDADLLARLHLRTTASAGMRRKGQLVGVLSIGTIDEIRQFAPDELNLLQGLADQAAQAITNAHLYAHNVQQLQALTMLYEGAQKLSQNLGLQQRAESVAQTCVEVFNVRLAWLGRREPDGRLRWLSHFPDSSGEFVPQAITGWAELPRPRSPVTSALRSGRPVIIGDLADENNAVPWREQALAHGLRCAAAFPLVAHDQPFGVLGLFSDQPDFFTSERIEVLQTYAHQAAISLENARLFEETERRLHQVQALRAIDVAIGSSLDLNLTLNVFIEQVITQLHVDATDVLLLNGHTHTLDYAAGRGFRTPPVSRAHLRLGEGYAGRVVLERQMLSLPDLSQEEPDFAQESFLTGESIRAYFGVPLIAKGQVQGVLEVFHRTVLQPDHDWLSFLETLAGQAAIAIESTRLFNDLQRANTNVVMAYDTTLEGWSRALDLRDKETEGHTQRVTEMTLRLARTMGLEDEELIHIRRGALLHDIGKMGIPDGILLKPGPLTAAEMDIMRRHPVYAYELLSPITYLRPALDIPYAHHEKWDGTGYPRGLKGETIPLAARIFSVVDVWDGLRSDRPYRAAWPEQKVIDYIRSLSGSHFDPQVVDRFMAIIGQS